MREKTIAMLLVVSMMLSLFAGCATTNPTVDPTGTSENTATTATEGSVAANTSEPTTAPTETEATEAPTEPPTAPPTEPTEPEPEITVVQQNSINMLNYLAFIAEEIYIAKDNRLILEDIYTSLMNEINPGTIDDITQDHLRNLRDVIKRFLHIETKRERLQYLYNQEKAASMRNAVPDPLAVLSMANSLDWKRLVASVAFTVVDSYNNYKTASENADQEFLLSGWELDDEETDTIQRNREYAFDYMVDIVQEYGTTEFTAKELGLLTLNEKAVEDFAEICAIEEVYLRCQRLEAAEKTYQLFGNYWIERANCYYEIAELEDSIDYYKKCLDCVAKYNELATGIFRQDFNIVPILPKAIVAAQEVYEGDEYVSNVQAFADAIIANTSDDEWSLRYFAAQVYIELYSRTDNKDYLWTAYEIVKNNVSQLIDEQCALNETYLNAVQKLTVEEPNYQYVSEDEKKVLKEEYKAEKKRVDAYNKELEEIRKTELPPLYEPLILNCDLLFALAEQLKISASEQLKIQKMLKTESNGVFLSEPVNDRYSFDTNSNDYAVAFSVSEIVIPADLLVQGARITVTVENASGSTTFEDYSISKVKREDASIESFVAYYSSKTIKSVEWAVGTRVIVQVYLGEGYDLVVFEFEVTEYKDNFVIADKIVFEAV